MKISRSAPWAFYASAVAALLAGCSSGALQSTSPSLGLGINSRALPVSGMQRGLRQPGDHFLGVQWSGIIHRDHRKSWISPDAKKSPRLLWVSDMGTGDVLIFAMPQMALTGTITGFQSPQGMCSDKQGHIYVTDTDAATVTEYSRSEHVVNTYTDLDGPPEACAVNPTNGDLAVVNYNSFDGSAGQILVYKHPHATPTVLTNPDQFSYWFAGYDPSGDLWEDGQNTADAVILASCNASSCSTINTSGGTIYSPGNVQWDPVRNTWVVFDQYCKNTEGSCSYPVSGSGALGKPTFYSNFNGGIGCDLVQGVVAANGMKYVVSADYEYCGFARSSVGRWAYPAGGTPTNYNFEDVSIPIGAAISTK